MADRSVCSPQLAKSDALNNTASFPNGASVTGALKVINTELDSSQVGVVKDEEELLKGLLNDDYCHVCEAVLLFESQRLSHYEGKKHSHKIKVYLQTKRAEKLNKESTVPQRTMPTDKERFCELCNMVFSSHLVANSHYGGKIHAKNLRKQVLHKYTDVCTLPRLSHNAENADQKSPPEGGVEHHEAPAPTTTTLSTEVYLKDPNKYCSLCAASFNNPQMALQHYNGRKHQRNRAKQELIKDLGDDVQQANSLMCQTCSLQFNSLEMYQAHVHGNKHQLREKKVTNLCKSQQKVYGTFADELADYIQAQKARGVTPKTKGQVPPQADTQLQGEEVEEGVKEVIDKRLIIELNKPMPSLSLTSDPHQSRPSSYYPAEGWRPPYQGPPWPPHSRYHNLPPPVLPGSPQFTSRPMKRRRRKQSSASSYSSSSSCSSSYSSSASSSMSDSDDSEYKRRERRRIRRSKKERGRRARDEDFDKEESQRKLQRKERADDNMTRQEPGEWEQERRRKKQKKHGKRRRKDRRTEDCEEEGGDGMMDNVKAEDMDKTKYTEVHIQAEINVEAGEQDESAKPKFRKEKKKTKERVDTRTEEEKLWDDSILGC